MRVYQSLLAPLRDRPLKLLEIGLDARRDGARCPSLDMWAEWLPNAEIVGVDILDYSSATTLRAKTVVADQSDRAAMTELARAHGPFDVIVDDGAHLSDAQQTSFFALFPALSPGGFYFIEDLHFQPPSEPADSAKTRTLFQAWRSGLRPDAIARLARRHGFSPREIAGCFADIDGLQFFDSLAPSRPPAVMADALLAIRKAG